MEIAALKGTEHKATNQEEGHWLLGRCQNRRKKMGKNKKWNNSGPKGAVAVSWCLLSKLECQIQTLTMRNCDKS